MSSPLSSISKLPKKLVIPDLSKLEKTSKDLDEVKKMCLGLPYSINQQELIDGRAFSKLKCYDLNKSNPVDPVLTNKILYFYLYNFIGSVVRGKLKTFINQENCIA